jgi:protein tyrosine/serine phosphatase
MRGETILLLQGALFCWRSAMVHSFSTPATFSEKNVQDIVMFSSKGEVESQEDKSFNDEIKALCKSRNLPLAKVKNCRDLSSTQNSPVKAGRLFRTGRLGDATDKDQELLFQEMGIKTLVDLRSPTELKDDLALYADLFADFTDLIWIENGRKKDGCVRELGSDESPIKRRRFRANKQNSKAAEEDEDEDEFCDYGCDDPKSLPAGKFLQTKVGRKERHFVSLMNEFKYVRGTVSKLPKRSIAKSILKAPGAVLSKRIWNSLKQPFLREINDGGLSMLNELLLRFGAPGIKYVLDVVADKERHPVAFYCTAGKDRTGTIAAIILSLVGVKPEDIVEDYSLSANVYAEMNDHQAMVGALSQRSLDPKTFLGAPPEVMADTLLSIEENYGSVEGYCDWIGFGEEQRKNLRKALLEA